MASRTVLIPTVYATTPEVGIRVRVKQMQDKEFRAGDE
jgi:hypothetical protein